jgi:hypothetical protein
MPLTTYSSTFEAYPARRRWQVRWEPQASPTTKPAETTTRVTRTIEDVIKVFAIRAATYVSSLVLKKKSSAAMISARHI